MSPPAPNQAPGAAPKTDPLTALEQRIGHSFKNRALLKEALTHPSAFDGGKGRSYQRLEFLGDRVLGLIVADKLCAEAENEEGLAPRFNALVERGACARAARRAGLGEAAILSRSEAAQGGRDKPAILADLAESVIAAIYLDVGYEAARAFVMRYWADEFESARTMRRDPKTVLQEWAASRKQVPIYEVMQQTGPDHEPHFVVEVRLEGLPASRGEGGSKREAMRAAAAALLAESGIDG